MPNKLANRVKMTVSGTPGTGTITLGSAVTGFTDFATGGVVNGNTVPYVIEDGVNWEIGVGTYSSTGPTLARTSITASNNSNAAISATANAIVMLSPLAADLQSTDTLTSGTLPVARGGTGLTSLTAGYIPFGSGTSALGNSDNLFWDSTNTQLAIVSTSATKAAVDITPGASAITMRLRARSTDAIADIQFTDNGATTAYANIRTPVANTLSFLTGGSERMRIDSAGRVAIGSTSTSAVNLRLGANISGGATSYGILQQQTIQSDVTSAAYGSTQVLSTAAASFTIPSLLYYTAQQGTIGAGSSITNQFGFLAQSTLTGATNNFGFYGNIASGTGRWNFYAGGTADNYFAGNVGIGVAPNSRRLQISSSDSTSICLIAGATRGLRLGASSVGGSIEGVDQTGSASYQPLVIGGSDVRFTTSNTERLRIDSSGAVGIGGIPTSNQTSLLVARNATGNVTQYLNYTSGQVQSDVTSTVRYYQAVASTAAATFTLSDLHHFNASQGTFGLGSTVTTQYGFHAQSNLTGATNNYGFYSNIASGTGRWNFYANGTADNYFAGNILRGNTTAISVPYYTGAQMSPSIQGHANTVAGASLALVDWAASVNSSCLTLGKSRGAIGTFTSVNSGDYIGAVCFSGDSGTQFELGASIFGAVDGTPSSTSMPGRLVFSTTAAGSVVPTERLRIDSSGKVLIGTSTAGASKLVVADDSIQINTAKTPASATATGTTGQVCWDASYIYVCTATNTWKRAAIATW